MGNIDEKRLSGLLERINQIKEDLESLENEVREIFTAAGSTAASGPAAVTGQVPVTETAAVTEPAEVTDNSAADEEPIVIDDTPIDIEIPSIDIPPVIEDPAAAYEQPATPVAEHDAVTEPVEVPQPNTADGTGISDASGASASSATGEAEEVTGTSDAPGASTSSATEDDENTALKDEATAQEGDDLPFDDDLPLDIPEAGPMPEPEPKTVTGTVDEAKPKTAIIDSKKAETAVMDVMAEKQAWRTDRPGSQVRNIISAISLNDRVLLINVLFREDPVLFQNTITAFNGMNSLDEAIAYIQTNFPEWDMNSEPVYRLMMAVRRKLS